MYLHTYYLLVYLHTYNSNNLPFRALYTNTPLVLYYDMYMYSFLLLGKYVNLLMPIAHNNSLLWGVSPEKRRCTRPWIAAGRCNMH